MKSKPRILYLIGSRDPGGAEKVLIDLSVYFQSKDFIVTVGHLGNEWLSNQLYEKKIHNLILPFSNDYFSHKTELFFIRKLLRFVKHYRFDLIHSHLFGMILYGSVVGKFARIPVIGTIHDKYYFSEKAYRGLAYKATDLLGCKLVTVSKDIKNALSMSSKIGKDRIRCIYNGAKLECSNITVNRNNERHSLGFTPDDFIIISVGRLAKIKAVERILHAGFRLVAENDKIKFLIVGDGPEKHNLLDLVNKSGFGSNFVFTGHRNDVNELLGISDMLIQLSLSEGLSCTIIEAITMGLPIVASDVGGNSEIVENGKEGFIVKDGDIAEVVNKIRQISDNVTLRKRLSMNARNTAVKFFSHQKMFYEYEQLYVECLS